jgi:hypothetical protein
MLEVPRITTIQQAPEPPWGKDPDSEVADEYVRDPKQFLLDRCALWTPSCHLLGSLVLCATYFAPPYDIMSNGQKWYRTDKSHDEAAWQGKVGLVIAKGPMAFVDEPELKVYFHGANVEIGDWVQWDIHDARQSSVHRVHCRYLRDVQIMAKWDDPRLVY